MRNMIYMVIFLTLYFVKIHSIMNHFSILEFNVISLLFFMNYVYFQQ